MTGIKVTLISPYEAITANGLRIISAYLKQQGHQVEMIFLNPSNSELGGGLDERVLADVAELCRSSDLVGLSLMTNHFILARELTIAIKQRTGTRVIWGGIHPTVRPEQCLEYADLVCIGEGEDAILELAQSMAAGGDITGIRNLWVKKDGEIVRNDVRDLEEDLDRYPFQDYDIDTHYILSGGRIVRMTEQLLEEAMPKNFSFGGQNVEYYLMTTRNCPHNCTYCCNDAFRQIYHKKGRFVRKRTARSAVEEIERVKSRFGFIRQVLITDDTFFIRTDEEIQEFCDLYKERIGLPLRCYVSPLTLTETKLVKMIDAGLFNLSMGVQSYSQETLVDVYQRRTPPSVISEKVALIDKYRDQIPNPAYHVIVDNPYQGMRARREDLRFVASLPAGPRVYLFPLVFYPGTQLYERAVKDGLIVDEVRDIYLKFWTIEDVRTSDYPTYLMYLNSKLTFFCNKYEVKLPIEKIMRSLSTDTAMSLCNNKVSLAIISALAAFIMAVPKLPPVRWTLGTVSNIRKRTNRTLSAVRRRIGIARV